MHTKPTDSTEIHTFSPVTVNIREHNSNRVDNIHAVNYINRPTIDNPSKYLPPTDAQLKKSGTSIKIHPLKSAVTNNNTESKISIGVHSREY